MEDHTLLLAGGGSGQVGWRGGAGSPVPILPQFSKPLGSVDDWNQSQGMSLSGQDCTHPLPAAVMLTALSGGQAQAVG